MAPAGSPITIIDAALPTLRLALAAQRSGWLNRDMNIASALIVLSLAVAFLVHLKRRNNRTSRMRRAMRTLEIATRLQPHARMVAD